MYPNNKIMPSQILAYLRKAHDRLARWPRANFCIALAVGNFVLVVLFAIPIAIYVGSTYPNRVVPFHTVWDSEWWMYFLDSVIMAPLIETLLIQVLFIELALRWRLSLRYQYALSVVPFFLPHALRAFPYGVISGICMGFSLAYCYLRWRKHSRRSAFWSTVTTHALYNALVMASLTASITIG
ncbi:CPBP family glutamic-type intramembrane protease [Chromobacterium sp. IIBBL 290-4]|uniref:CPBP family glutamic-type intramembrane protease n=1 Tax=Chromobacterium sp. IIBBL 290-4 TaxID=2953890 RepID=UPI0020B65A66|nr:CPBP family glutamic-type intramembrane protease [Chromobacterium sp. IIBBL 290-4]UTH75764.1 CPBP family glutamic-type intramembrane protease [Chromobacterium sp. IIBBL 290-4]